MKRYILTTTVLASAYLVTTHAQLVPFLFGPQISPAPPPSAATPPSNRLPFAPNQRPDQAPMASPETPVTSTSNPAVILSDVLGAQDRANIFAGFTRDISSVAVRVENPLLNTTVLAPLNSAMTALPRKPWEDPAEYAARGAGAYVGSEGQDRALKNLQRFTEAHVVPVSPWREGEKVDRMRGGKVWWEKNGEGKMKVMPDGVEVEGVVEKVGNGEVWLLKGVLDFAA